MSLSLVSLGIRQTQRNSGKKATLASDPGTAQWRPSGPQVDQCERMAGAGRQRNHFSLATRPTDHSCDRLLTDERQGARQNVKQMQSRPTDWPTNGNNPQAPRRKPWDSDEMSSETTNDSDHTRESGTSSGRPVCWPRASNSPK